MSSVDPAAQEAALPYRVYGLEGQARTQDAAITRLREGQARNSEAISAQAVTLAKHDEQLSVGREDIVEAKTDIAALAASVVALGEKVATSSNRIAWTFASFALSALGGTIIVVVTQ
jgi:hypothetical protein